mmetsp:Transcript_23188/g.57496  ORF Transcript_23188/g.57496 Transcript_23188/m.57496 type:complete len:229 (+) Transcript_23188:224-910(+)
MMYVEAPGGANQVSGFRRLTWGRDWYCGWVRLTSPPDSSGGALAYAFMNASRLSPEVWRLPGRTALSRSPGVWYRCVFSTNAKSNPGVSPTSRKMRWSVLLLMIPDAKISASSTEPWGLGAACDHMASNSADARPEVAWNMRCGPPLPIASRLSTQRTSLYHGCEVTTPCAPMKPSSSALLKITTAAPSRRASGSLAPCATRLRISSTAIPTLAPLSDPPLLTWMVST